MCYNYQNFLIDGDFMEKFQHGGQIYNSIGTAEKFFDFSANINPLGRIFLFIFSSFATEKNFIACADIFGV